MTMERIVFDTNFIMTCINQKIDFIKELEGYALLLPVQVIKELEKLSEDRAKKLEERSLARISLSFLHAFMNKFQEIELKKKFVDRGIELLEGDYIIATLDKELQRKLKGRFQFLIITKQKKLEIVN